MSRNPLARRFRSCALAEIADDMTGTAPVVKHAVAALQASGDEITCACCIYATAPFVRASGPENSL